MNTIGKGSIMRPRIQFMAGMLILAHLLRSTSANGEQIMAELHARNMAKAILDCDLIVGVFENTEISKRDNNW